MEKLPFDNWGERFEQSISERYLIAMASFDIF